MIPSETINQTACELHLRAATRISPDVRAAVSAMCEAETCPLPKYVLKQVVENYETAKTESRPMCSDTGLPRFYVKLGNEARVEGGMIAMEHELRKATAFATADIPLRPNRVHPFSRKDFNNNVGMHAPSVDYSFEPDADWVDITVVHKGGLFGGDYRMLFPADGESGIRRFLLDTLSEFFRRGMSCQPAIIGLGIGGAKDTCVRLAKEAACLRLVGDRNPDPEIASLEDGLVDLGNQSGFGAMGYHGDGAVMDVHIEAAYAHTGGMPISIQHFCFAARRSTARIHADGQVEFRDDPKWFTPYYRREGVES